MDRASSLTYPGGRALAGWWRQLQPHRPEVFWVGHLFLHRVEAPVTRADRRPADPLTRLALQAVGIDPAGATIDAVQGRLHLPAPAVRRLLAGLHAEQLVAPTADGWRVTERGGDVMRGGAYDARRAGRHVFPFVERLTSDGRRHAPPHFLPIGETDAAPWQADAGTRFDAAALDDALGRPEDWKRRFSFPADVSGAAAGDEEWRRVLVDRTERPLVALIRTAPDGGEARLLGFVGHVPAGRLEAEPVLDLPADAVAELPELAAVPTADEWRQAWLTWCRQRNLPPTEAEHCGLTPGPQGLEVNAPHRLVERLRQAKSDIFRGEAWVLGGDGYVRQAALLRLAGEP
jgi:hypothetical protein